MQKENSLIVSLDIGTYKTAVVVAEPTPEGIDVLGIGGRSEGVDERGVIRPLQLDGPGIELRRPWE